MQDTIHHTCRPVWVSILWLGDGFEWSSTMKYVTRDFTYLTGLYKGTQDHFTYTIVEMWWEEIWQCSGETTPIHPQVTGRRSRVRTVRKPCGLELDLNSRRPQWWKPPGPFCCVSALTLSFWKSSCYVSGDGVLIWSDMERTQWLKSES